MPNESLCAAPLPLFRRDEEYCELSPKEGRYRWRWKLLRDVRTRMLWFTGDRISFTDASNREWMRFERGGWRVMRRGYVWNGCSPKRHVPIFGWVGTPDTPYNLLASLNHDGGYQFSGTDNYWMTREAEDRFFYDTMRASGFRFASLYHGAVRDFGGFSFGINRDGLKSTLLA